MSSERLRPDEVESLLAKLNAAVKAGILRRKRPKGYILAAFEGTGTPISEKWNVNIYAKTGFTQAVVCVDFSVLETLWHGSHASLQPSSRAVLTIDDAGWGFPLLGAFVGVSDGRIVRCREVPIRFFRPPMGREDYLQAFTERGLALIAKFGATKDTHRVEICTGYINSGLRETLRDFGWEVRVTKVVGLLQDRLEAMYKQYVKTRLGVDIYYDPKEIRTDAIPRAYHDAVRFGVKNCPHLLKTSWEALAKYRTEETG